MTTIPVRKSKSKRPPRKGKGNFMTEMHKVFGGRVKVFRTKQSGDVWQMRVWIRETQTYFRKSLRTEYLPEALETAEEEYIDLRAKVKAGDYVLELPAKKLVEKYLEFRNEDVINRNITPQRLMTINSQLKHFLYIFGEKVKLSSIPREKMQHYESLRREYAPNVKTITLANELSTMKNFYQYCFDRRLVNEKFRPLFPKISKRPKNEKTNRDDLTRNEWRLIHKYLKVWHKGKSDKEQDERYFVRYFILLLMTSGIRFGEARKIRWESLSVHMQDQEGYLRIDLKEGKTGPRVVVCRRHDLFKRLKDLSNHKKPTDLVFVDNKTGQEIKKDIYYRYWKEILRETELDKLSKQIVYYSCRHTYATWSLLSGVDIYDLSLNMGCSIHFIEEHYGHVKTDMKWKSLVNKISPENFKFFLGG